MLKKDGLVDIVRKVLKTQADIGFLLKLDEDELKVLIESIRGRVDNFPGKGQEN